MIYSLAFYLKLVLKVAVLAGPFFATCFSRSTYWSCHFLISLSLIIWITVHQLALFLVVYIGVEVKKNNWRYNMFTLRVAQYSFGVGPSSGYVSTGFISGKYLGDLVLNINF
jgi:hypothetical protein